MSNPTNPFSWQMPTATDLVTDLPADFEVFGQAVATSLADLLGGTAGQVLKKNTNADMDFVWSADAAGMTNPMTTTGDTIYSSSGSTPARLGIGSSGNVLTVAGGVPTWAAPVAGGSYTSLASGSLPTGASTLTISSISGSYQELKLILRDYSVTLNNFFINFRLNGDTGSNYGHCNYFTTAVDTVSFSADSVDDKITHPNSLRVGDNFLMFSIQDYANSSSFKTPTLLGMARANGDTFDCFLNATAYYKSTTAITSIDVFTGAQNFSGGTYELFGVK
jgi:hypothetical protein